MRYQKEASLRNALDVITAGDVTLLPQAVHAHALHTVEEAKPWVAGRNIVGFGVAERTTCGHPDADVCLKVYVNRKMPKGKLDAAERVPERVSIPGFDDAVFTDIEEIGELVPELFTNKTRPITPGCSVGHVEADTRHVWIYSEEEGNAGVPLALSNCHVLANYGLAKPGDSIIQPGRDDGGHPGDHIGHLLDFTRFIFGEGYDNVCDAAVFELVAPVEAAKLIPQIGIPPGVRTDIARGLQVQKTGRTTEHTIGVIRDEPQPRRPAR